MSHELIIRGGTVVDGTGGRAGAGRCGCRRRPHHHHRRSERGDGRRRDRRDRQIRHTRLHRSSHPSRRADRLGSDDDIGELAWRHHRDDRELWGHLCAGVARQPRVPGRDDGVRRGHPEGSDPQRSALELVDLRRVPRCGTDTPAGPQRGGPRRPLRGSLSRDGGALADRRSPDAQGKGRDGRNRRPGDHRWCGGFLHLADPLAQGARWATCARYTRTGRGVHRDRRGDGSCGRRVVPGCVRHGESP